MSSKIPRKPGYKLTASTGYLYITFPTSDRYPYPLAANTSPDRLGSLNATGEARALKIREAAKTKQGVVYDNATESVHLDWSDLRTLEPHHLLTDQVLNAGYHQLHVRLPTTSFYYFDTDFLRTISQQHLNTYSEERALNYRKRDGLPLDKEFLFIPVHYPRQLHWGLYVVYKDQIIYHDSLLLHTEFKKHAGWIARFLNLRRGGPSRTYHARVAPGQKQQLSVDCGVWVVYTGHCILKKKDYRQIVPRKVQDYRLYLTWMIGGGKVYVNKQKQKVVATEEPATMPAPPPSEAEKARNELTIGRKQRKDEEEAAKALVALKPKKPRKPRVTYTKEEHGIHYKFILGDHFPSYALHYLALIRHPGKPNETMIRFLRHQFKNKMFYSAATHRWRKNRYKRY